MSGHSKWSTIKHKKAAADAKRGRAFTKIIREITVATRAGGGDPGGNPRLRAATLAARDVNMPADNIKRAIQKGTGELAGSFLEELVYEGYGPGGVAVMVQAMTDNRNRTLAEIRHLFSKYGGNLGEANCVSWMFEKRGTWVVPRSGVDEEKLFELVIEAGAEDLEQDGEHFEIFSTPEQYEKVHEALTQREIPIASSELAMTPKTTVRVEGKQARQVLNMMEALEDHDDVQHVWANFDIDDSEIAGA
ncbi:MAG: YebC/PmpR family DNA-binding transcriptional regulator [Acidobacteriota bacterium]